MNRWKSKLQRERVREVIILQESKFKIFFLHSHELVLHLQFYPSHPVIHHNEHAVAPCLPIRLPGYTSPACKL